MEKYTTSKIETPTVNNSTGVEIQYNDDTKLQTTNTGAAVTGILEDSDGYTKGSTAIQGAAHYYSTITQDIPTGTTGTPMSIPFTSYYDDASFYTVNIPDPGQITIKKTGTYLLIFLPAWSGGWDARYFVRIELTSSTTYPGNIVLNTDQYKVAGLTAQLNIATIVKIDSDNTAIKFYIGQQSGVTRKFGNSGGGEIKYGVHCMIAKVS